MHRCYCPDLPNTGIIALPPEEAHHAGSVLRLQVGDSLVLFDGAGREAQARVCSASKKTIEVEIESVAEVNRESKRKLTIAIALPKGDRQKWLIEKCVELGVSRIVPVVSRRCVVKPVGKDTKLIRWQKVAQEAAKQCGRARIPQIGNTESLEKTDLSSYDAVLVAYENEGETSLKSVLRSERKLDNIAVVIGPEGGFEPAEVERMLERGGVAVSLGRRILRTETAGMAMLAQIMYELEN